jgi:hypothetical protein
MSDRIARSQGISARQVRPEEEQMGRVHVRAHGNFPPDRFLAALIDVVPDPEAAVEWAVRDVRIRRSGPTLSLLGWCLFRAGRIEEARWAIAEALSLGAGDPRHQARARTIGAG